MSSTARHNNLFDATPIPTGTQELTGTVQSIVWSNWGQPDLEPSEHAVIARITGQQAVKGPCAEDGIEVGLAYRFLGRWVENARFGRQFQFTTFTRSEPGTKGGTIRYLVKLCPNVGETKAARLWECLGPKAVETVRTNPEHVASLGILSLDQAREAAEALAVFAGLEQTRVELFGLFDRRGFPGKVIEAAIGKFGAAAAKRIRKNPYCLMTARPSLPGAGFKRCDKLYLDLGHPPTALKRQMLAGWYSLKEEAQGHTWYAAGGVREAIRQCCKPGLFGGSQDAVDPDRAIELGVRSCWLATRADAGGEEWIAEAGKARNERELSARVAILRQGRCLWKAAAAEIVAEAISDHQRERLALALREPVAILGGTPGTGKSHVAGQLVRWLACRFGLERIAVAAPTGKAAVRMNDFLTRSALNLGASTIHRLLGVGRSGRDGNGWEFQRNADRPLEQQFLIIDEMSMTDVDLACALLKACSPGTHILFVGDTNQLPPVGHGAPLRDLVDAGICYGEFTEIRRQGAEPNLIVKACAAIKGEQPFEFSDTYDPVAGLNLKFVETADPKEQVEFLPLVLERVRALKLADGSRQLNPVWDCQVIVAVNGKSEISRAMLNKQLQAILNPAGVSSPQCPFRVSDKVICTKNGLYPQVEPDLGYHPADEPKSYVPCIEWPNVFVANGDIGRVLAVGPKQAVARFDCPARTVRISIGKPKDGEDEQKTVRTEDDGDGGGDGASDRVGTGCDFSLAYAVTCHKMQGSECPVVIVMVDETPGARRVCSREWIYTAISRAKQLCVLIGKEAVARQMCKRVSLTRRKTFLKELLLDASAR